MWVKCALVIFELNCAVYRPRHERRETCLCRAIEQRSVRHSTDMLGTTNPQTRSCSDSSDACIASCNIYTAEWRACSCTETLQPARSHLVFHVSPACRCCTPTVSPISSLGPLLSGGLVLAFAQLLCTLCLVATVLRANPSLSSACLLCAADCEQQAVCKPAPHHVPFCCGRFAADCAGQRAQRGRRICEPLR